MTEIKLAAGAKRLSVGKKVFISKLTYDHTPVVCSSDEEKENKPVKKAPAAPVSAKEQQKALETSSGIKRLSLSLGFQFKKILTSFINS